MKHCYVNFSIRDLFSLTCEDVLCNTSYPLRPEFFSQYRSTQDIMKDVSELSFYFHIPFCKSLCKFCEYTRFLVPSVNQEIDYIGKLKLQVLKFILNHNIKKLCGLDIGGGTPTAISATVLEELLLFIHDLIQRMPLSHDFEPSMEFSFASIDDEKIDIIAKYGIKRLSTGIQVFDTGLMNHFGRINSPIKKMSHILSRIKKSGIKKINIDIMYGFEEQDESMLENSINVIEELHPNQVTLYEMRYNNNGVEYSHINRNILFEQYLYLFQKIKALGFKGEFGQNTFSLFDDFGVSSYLRSRMLNCTPYKGFGVSAQSMSLNGISYNILKSSKALLLPPIEEIKEEDVYLLPAEEIAAKYVCVALYSGRFSLNVLSKILGRDATKIYANELEFLIENNLVSIRDKICYLTEKGFKFYGAVASLFWSDRHKELYLSSRD